MFVTSKIDLFQYTILFLWGAFSVSAQQLEVPDVDNSTYTGKAMFGYQGWFGHPQDSSPRPNYWHWGDLDQIGVGPLEVEMYPDLREFSESEKYPTAYRFANGDTVPVFSSGNKQTVLRHMKWVRDYNTDGVFLQRFISEYGDPVVMEFRDSVATAVMEGCETYGRVFAVMYDGVADAVEEIKTDWMHMVDDLGITNSDRYLHHDERPLVSLWGFTFYNDATIAQLDSLIDWFHAEAPLKYRASIKLGLNDDWFDLSSDWRDAFSQVEVISPWSVGRFDDQPSYTHYLENQLIPGKSWCDMENILFVPVLFPGFSWHNLMDGGIQNQIPRDGGNFFWMQAHEAVEHNFESMYFAMLDEVDESTAFFKTSENAQQSPDQGYWLNLDADGYDLPSDWYLRCAGKAADALRGVIPNSQVLGQPSPGIMTIHLDQSTCSMEFVFPDFNGATHLEISLDGGNTYPYMTADHLATHDILGLPAGTYSIFARHPGEAPVPMGAVTLNDQCSLTSDVQYNLDDAIEVFPNPTGDIFHITGLTENYQIRIINAQGLVLQSLFTANEITLDLSDVPTGIHFLEISGINNSKLYFRTILKE